MSTLAQLVDIVGPAVIRVVAAPRGLDLEVRDILVHDLADPPEVGRGDLLLGVGVGDPAVVADLVRTAGANQAAGLVVKSHVVPEREGSALGEEGGAAILTIDRGTSWSQVLAMMQSGLTHGGFHLHGEKLGGLEAGDLFAFADAVAELVDAPVTIEDRMSRIVAYSGRQEEADAARTEVLVGRKVPARFVRLLEEQGVFRELEVGGGSLYVDPIAEGVIPRLAVAIRAGDEILGSMWAACREEPPKERRAAFEDAAKLAALHLLKHRAGADIERRLEADLIAAALHGGSGAREAVTRLGLGRGGFIVLAAGFSADGEEAGEVDRLQLRDLFSVEFAASRIKGAAGVLGNSAYALLAVSKQGDAASTAMHLAQGLLRRAGSGNGPRPVVGIGRYASSVRSIARSRSDADATLRVLVEGRSPSPVASIEEVSLQALLLRFADFAQDEKSTFEQKLRPLIESDANRNTGYLETLRAFLDTFGDVGEASKRLMVHPNTLRYRLVRLQEIARIDLDDPSERLALMIHLSAFQGR